MPRIKADRMRKYSPFWLCWAQPVTLENEQKKALILSLDELDLLKIYFFCSITSIQIHFVSGGIYRKRAYLLIRNRNAVKTPFIAPIEYLRFGSFQSDFSEISHTVFFYFKWYRERKYSETKYYVSQCPITLLITLAWQGDFKLSRKCCWNDVNCSLFKSPSGVQTLRRDVLFWKGLGRDMPHGRLQFLLAHTAIFRSYPR